MASCFLCSCFLQLYRLQASFGGVMHVVCTPSGVSCWRSWQKMHSTLFWDHDQLNQASTLHNGATLLLVRSPYRAGTFSSPWEVSLRCTTLQEWSGVPWAL